jgi:hypothetical protein
MTLSKTHRTVASLITAGCMLSVPAAVQAAKPAGKVKAPKAAKSCERQHKAGFVVHGALVSATADDPATAASEATVTLTVKSANAAARRSGDIADQDAAKPGIQVKGATYTVAAGDAYVLKLRNYEGTDTPSAGDRVTVLGTIAVTKKHCAPAGTSVADRLGATNVRRVTIADRDPDA